MLADEECTLQITVKACICGSIARYKTGTVAHYIGANRILLHNDPHYYCSFCKQITYDINLKITPLLKFAYSNGLKEIDWNQRE
ncbi:YgiT-type zinc finger domain-containing protein [Brevibacillus sp. SIMBA_040]|uniref:YgiT-type zinc finger domain-containing protein n=1 Tax=unclassified Brevibacillus TaxID=2684853 RepID=UPI00397BF809